jgi:hypothetical protein
MEIYNGWDLVLLPIDVAVAIINKCLDLIARLLCEMQTWPERTRNYWRFDNPDHLSPETKRINRADERWKLYAATDEGKRRLRRD